MLKQIIRFGKRFFRGQRHAVSSDCGLSARTHAALEEARRDASAALRRGTKSRSGRNVLVNQSQG